LLDHDDTRLADVGMDYRGGNRSRLVEQQGDDLSESMNVSPDQFFQMVGQKHGYSTLAESLIESRARQVEVQVIGNISAIEVILIFEGFPVWLLGLEPSKFRKIYIFGFSNKDQLMSWLLTKGHQVELLERVICRVSNKRLVYQLEHSGINEKCLVLVSGSLGYVDASIAAMSQGGTTNIIGVVDHHFHDQLRNGRPAGISLINLRNGNIWTRVQHESVGGVTCFTALFCSIVELSPQITALRRTIHHIVDYSVRPSCIRENDSRRCSALTLQSRLHPGFLDQLVAYTTHFCGNGLGLRF
jgi:hypothetical protein